ncbi:hypothetical protein AEQ27_09705 [Frigoribacterium sp. RIT-PI-h]|nr:hypothetical protein AEQ27_09705 [Frigoribacterium sp. RIT-PI-h]
MLPALCFGGACIMVGAFKGVRDGLAGEPFLFTPLYRKWGLAGMFLMVLDSMAIVVWLVTLPG